MLPSKNEWAVLALLVVGCTAIVGLSPQRDVSFMWCGGAVTLIAALMGYRRNQVRLAVLAEEADERVKSEE